MPTVSRSRSYPTANPRTGFSSGHTRAKLAGHPPMARTCGKPPAPHDGGRLGDYGLPGMSLRLVPAPVAPDGDVGEGPVLAGLVRRVGAYPASVHRARDIGHLLNN